MSKFKNFTTIRFSTTTKVLLGVTIVLATVAALQHKGIASLNEFLEDENLLNKYYKIGE